MKTLKQANADYIKWTLAVKDAADRRDVRNYRVSCSRMIQNHKIVVRFLDMEEVETDKRCADCRNGEHENYDDYVYLVMVRDPDTKKIVKRSYMCSEHREMYCQDGMEVLA